MRDTPSRVAGDRWAVIRDLVGPDAASVLDVGCRDRALRSHLPAGARYVGIDLFPPADVIASAEEPLPFDDRSFDAVVLADVLEHLNHPHRALDEALRVGSRSVVVLLPNVYSLLHRLQFARGELPGDKYAFGPEDSLDRHRWVMSFDQARAFTRGRAAAAGWTVAREHAYEYRFNRPLARGLYRLARAVAGPGLWSWEYVARLEPSR